MTWDSNPIPDHPLIHPENFFQKQKNFLLHNKLYWKPVVYIPGNGKEPVPADRGGGLGKSFLPCLRHRGRGSYSQGDRVVKPENVAVLVMSRVPSPSLENTGEGWLVLIYWPIHTHTGIWSLRWKASECQSDQARVNSGVTMTEWTEDPVTLLCRWYDSIVWYFCRLTKYVCGHSG